jgi:alpha-L-fucosidase
MKRARAFGLGLATGLLALAAPACAAPEESGRSPASRSRATAEEMRWWLDAKFGVFMHWGPSSLSEKSISWSRHGPRPGHSSKHAKSGTPVEIYDNLYKRFNPVNFDADAWIRMVRDAGAKYLIFTVKHHDGFCMWDSAYTDYDIMSTPFKRDICRELADACRKHDIKLFWYYSQPDWHHPDYSTERHDRFVRYLHDQVRELCTKYGKIDGFWWDGLGRPPETWGSDTLIPMIRRLQPGIIMNHRFSGRHLMKEHGDFDTAENHIGHFQVDRPWESCIKIGGPWSWGGLDRAGLSADTCLRTLIRCVGRGGNLALNTGPSPLGEIHPKDREVYLAIGRWLAKHGESLYGTRAGPYKPGPWGVCVSKRKTVYLHVMQIWPDGELALPPLEAKVLSAKALTGGAPEVRQDATAVRIRLDAARHDPLDTVIALTLDRDAAGLALVEGRRGASLTVGKRATASTEGGAKCPAMAAVADTIKTFEEGAYVKSCWQPQGNDKAPWLQVDLGAPATFAHVVIRERGAGVDAFRIECREGDEAWTVVHRGRTLGDFSLCIRPVRARQVRLVIEARSGLPRINSFDLFP